MRDRWTVLARRLASRLSGTLRVEGDAGAGSLVAASLWSASRSTTPGCFAR